MFLGFLEFFKGSGVKADVCLIESLILPDDRVSILEAQQQLPNNVLDFHRHIGVVFLFAIGLLTRTCLLTRRHTRRRLKIFHDHSRASFVAPTGNLLLEEREANSLNDFYVKLSYGRYLDGRHFELYQMAYCLDCFVQKNKKTSQLDRIDASSRRASYRNSKGLPVCRTSKWPRCI